MEEGSFVKMMEIRWAPFESQIIPVCPLGLTPKYISPGCISFPIPRHVAMTVIFACRNLKGFNFLKPF